MKLLERKRYNLTSNRRKKNCGKKSSKKRRDWSRRSKSSERTKERKWGKTSNAILCTKRSHKRPCQSRLSGLKRRNSCWKPIKLIITLKKNKTRTIIKNSSRSCKKTLNTSPRSSCGLNSTSTSTFSRSKPLKQCTVTWIRSTTSGKL